MTTVFLSHPPSMLAAYYGPRALRALRSVARVDLNPHEHIPTTAELAQLAHGAEVIVSYRQTVGDEALFASLPRLLAFVRCAVDIRNIDVPAASRHGILVTQASAGFVPAVSEWVLGAMIDLSRSTSDYVVAQRSGHPVPQRMGRELRHATLGLVGHGQIGRYLCDVALALGMRIVVHDPYVDAVHASVQRVGFDELLATSDFVVCLAKATDDNHHLFDAKAFSAMRPDAIFINASRGSLVDEDALRHALDAGTIAGCALDVGQGPDQMPTPLLAAHPRVLATPHVGGLTLPAIEHQSMETVAQVRELLAGREPVGAVNAREAHRWQRARQLEKTNLP
ncbi:NAD(P)-dependent oxidoreductase [Hydrogenophaga sp. 2FB]|uniref:NAD(P)-dependent oxidoreductase n=1 Tax=Hydrogenophaga sp. 2FB TaxID=2502187 RepID=UPI0010F7B50D|nr:NAD(P)-dependent oxidoreductase [Hydrogenophaga sp. 2FB]